MAPASTNTAKAPRTVRNTTATRSQTKASPSVDDLATNLANELHIQPPRNPEPAKRLAVKTPKSQSSTDTAGPSKTRQATASAPSRKVTTSSKPTPLEETTPASGEEEAAVQHPWNQPETIASAMNAYNQASQAFNSIHQTGWKVSAAPKERAGKAPQGASDVNQHTMKSVIAAAQVSHSTLQRVRALGQRSRALDVEKAAAAFVSRLVAMELYTFALEFLVEAKGVLLGLYPDLALGSSLLSAPDELSTTKTAASRKAQKKTAPSQTPSPFNLEQYQDIHCFALPTSGEVHEPVLLYLLAMHQMHSLVVLAKLAQPHSTPPLDEVLQRPGNILNWLPHYSASLESKKVQSILNSVARSLSSPNSDPTTLIRTRVLGLKALLAAPELDRMTFWGQALKCAQAYKAKNRNSSSTDSDVEVANEIQVFFGQLVDAAEARPDAPAGLSGEQFVAAAEYWMKFARWLKDFAAMDRIGRLLDSASQGVRANGGPSSSRQQVDPVAHAAQMRTILTRAIVFLQQLETSLPDHIVSGADAIKDATLAIPQCFDLLKLDPKSKGASSLSRLVDDIVRLCNRLLPEHDSDMEECLKTQVVQMVSAIVMDGEKWTKGCTWNQIVAEPSMKAISLTAISGYLFLSATSTSLHRRTDPSSATKSYQCLQSAVGFLRLSESDPRSLTDAERLEYAHLLRTLSGALHNSAAKLLNEGKDAASAPFWQRAAELGEEAWELWQPISGGTSVSGEEVEAWTTLREKHILLRWDLLASAHFRSGERKLAHQAFICAILARPKKVFDALATESGSQGTRHLFSSKDRFTQAIERVTNLATFDLFLKGDDVSLRSILEQQGIAKAAVGAILEFQLVVLEPASHREETADAVRVLLKDLKEVYLAGEFPLRRARILLRSLELSYSTDDSSHAPSPVVVQGFLETKHLAEDVGLSQFAPQYSISLEILLALRAHQRQESEESTTAILSHANKAIRGLWGMLQMTSAEKLGQRTDGTGQASKPAGRKGAAGGTKPRAVPAKGKKAAPPKTPRKKASATASGVESLTTALGSLQLTSQSSPQSLRIDDEDRFYRRLTNFSNLLGLLGHIFPRMELLDIIRRICEHSPALPGGADGYVRASVQLAHEYIMLGKTERAAAVYGQALLFGRTSTRKLSPEVQVIFLLRYAESLAAVNNIEKSLAIYAEAAAVASSITMPDKTMPSMTRVMARLLAHERNALACNVFAAIQLSREDMTSCLMGLTQSVRLWNQAMQVVAKWQQQSRKESHSRTASASSNPFEVAASNEASSSSRTGEPAERALPKVRDNMMDGLQWRLAEGLASTMFALGKLNFLRGSVKLATYWTQYAQDLTASVNAPVPLSRALANEAELELHMGQLETGHDLLDKALSVWTSTQDILGPDLVNLRRLQGHQNVKLDQPDEAKKVFSLARDVVARLEDVYSQTDGQLSASKALRRSSVGMASQISGQDTIIPTVLASILRQSIWLLRSDEDEDAESEYNDLLARLLALPASAETKAEENTLMGKLRLEEVMARFDADLYLSSIPESVMALPLGMSSGEGASPLASTREIQSALSVAEDFFWSAMELSCARGTVYQVRETALALMQIRVYQNSLGRVKRNGNNIAASLLDMSASITLRRELLECVGYKLQGSLMPSDNIWPLMSSNGAPLPPAPARIRSNVFSDESDDEDDNQPNMQTYWQSIRNRYKSETMDAAGLASSQADHLPDNWTVVNISVAEDQNTLFVSRQRPRSEPLVFCLPLNRQGRREGDDDHFSFEKAKEEFAEIIALNDETIKNAKHATDKETRSNWWAERAQLDNRMRDLLQNIEYCWLGAFKTILSEPTTISADVFPALRAKFDKLFKRNGIISNERKSRMTMRLDDSVLECFISLTPKCRDEELEDLVYFVLDLYQLHGVPVALSEIDIDQLCIDIRSALEEHCAKVKNQCLPLKDQHLFLVLDKHAQGFPWESIPILRGRSVARIPSISFLVDRLELVKHQGSRTSSASLSVPSSPNNIPDRTVVDPLKTFYILNPTGDLTTTQETYESSFTDMEKLGWRGVTGREPSEDEMLQALSRNDLVLYFGHGGGQKYTRSHKLRHLQTCAATMLWGCSSGNMKDMGDFDRAGTPNHYMLAGCPTLVANLWDVTDREIDRIAQSVLTKLHITKGDLTLLKDQPKPRAPISVIQAVAESREVPKFKYLTGAAPVVYGIPFYL